MKFFVLLVALFLQMFSSFRLKRHKSEGIDSYIQRIHPFLTKINADEGWYAVLGLLLPVLILVLILNMIFGPVRLLYFIYAIFILCVCLNYQDMKKILSHYFMALKEGDMYQAQTQAEQFIGQPTYQQSGEMTRAVTEAIFQRALTGLLGVICWFMLLGPFGAVLYYMTVSLFHRAQHNDFPYPGVFLQIEYLKEILDWIPVRFVTFTFALVGHFRPVFAIWIDRLGGGLFENKHLLIDAGLTALGADVDPVSADRSEENRRAVALISRTLLTWMIFIALATFLAWL